MPGRSTGSTTFFSFWFGPSAFGSAVAIGLLELVELFVAGAERATALEEKRSGDHREECEQAHGRCIDRKTAFDEFLGRPNEPPGGRGRAT
jgi:hypothetical protein